MSKYFTHFLRRWWPSTGRYFAAIAVFLTACIVLGGGTREGFLSDVILQAAAVPLLLWSACRLLEVPREAGGRRARWALSICAAAALVPLAQLVPLPPSLWTLLPGRADFESNLLAAGLQVGWLPLSVSPRATWLGLLALLPPAAMFLGVLHLSYADRRRLTVVMLALGLISVALGLLQVAQGRTSPLRFFAFTNTSEAVGFFANRNHYSALLYCLVLVAAAWSVDAVTHFTDGRTRLRRASRSLVTIILSFTALVILVGAQAMARARAGLVLTPIALIGAFAFASLVPTGNFDEGSIGRRGTATRTWRRLLIATVSLSVLFGAQLAIYRIGERFAQNPLDDARVPFARNTIAAAIAYMPFGSGIGTFVSVYPEFEKATDGTGEIFVNRAHNDFLELWLETGVAGLIASLLFLIWLVCIMLRIWRRGMPGGAYKDNLLASAATLILVLLLAHSTVDYPLRTTALMAVFAMSAAMALAPVGVEQIPSDRYRRDDEEPSAPARDADVSARPRRSTFVPAPPPQGDWPAAWRDPKDLR